MKSMCRGFDLGSNTGISKGVFATGIIAAVIISVALVYFAPSLNLGGGKRVVASFLQPTQVTVNEVQYTIITDMNEILVYTGVVPANKNSQHLTSPQQGQTYPCLGLNIKILEAGADKYILSITSGK
jgi:hypothetical protein